MHSARDRRSSETGGECVYTPSDSYDKTHGRTGAARPIALADVQSSDHLVIRAALSHNLTTVAFIVQQSHTNAR